jgi:uncharacterized protein (DUF849 family)
MLLKACVNGPRRPGEHRAQPVTAADLATDVRRVVAAGADAVHFRRHAFEEGRERRICGAWTRRFRLVPGVMKDLEPRM